MHNRPVADRANHPTVGYTEADELNGVTVRGLLGATLGGSESDVERREKNGEEGMTKAGAGSAAQ